MKILLVEDNLINRKLMIRLLEKKSHQVKSAQGGLEALEILSKEAFDLIFMDIQMPGMDGLQTTALIREKEKGGPNHIPIVALTAHNQIGDQERFLKSGFDGYLAKPVKYEEIYDIVDNFSAAEGQKYHGAIDDNLNKRIWDKAELMTRVAHDHQLMREVIKYFINDCPNKMNAMKTALKEHQDKAFYAEAHGLKGAAANISACSLVDICQVLEKTGMEKNWELAAKKLAELQIEVEKLKEILLDDGIIDSRT